MMYDSMPLNVDAQCLVPSRFCPTLAIDRGTIRLGMTARLCYVYVRANTTHTKYTKRTARHHTL